MQNPETSHEIQTRAIDFSQKSLQSAVLGSRAQGTQKLYIKTKEGKVDMIRKLLKLFGKRTKIKAPPPKTRLEPEPHENPWVEAAGKVC